MRKLVESNDTISLCMDSKYLITTNSDCVDIIAYEGIIGLILKTIADGFQIKFYTIEYECDLSLVIKIIKDNYCLDHVISDISDERAETLEICNFIKEAIKEINKQIANELDTN